MVKKLGDNLYKKIKNHESLIHSINKSPSMISKDLIPLSENHVAVENDIVTTIFNKKTNNEREDSINNYSSIDNKLMNSNVKKSPGLIDRINTNTNKKSSVTELARIEIPKTKQRKYAQEDKKLNHLSQLHNNSDGKKM
jgi:hypothetical protein